MVMVRWNPKWCLLTPYSSANNHLSPVLFIFRQINDFIYANCGVETFSWNFHNDLYAFIWNFGILLRWNFHFLPLCFHINNFDWQLSYFVYFLIVQWLKYTFTESIILTKRQVNALSSSLSAKTAFQHPHAFNFEPLTQ